MRDMVLRRGLLVIALAATVIPAAAAAIDKSDTLRREFVLASAAAREVVIDNVFGSVEVRAGAGDRVTVEIERKATARRPDDLALAFSEVTLDVIEGNGRLELVQDGPFRCGDGWSHRRNRGEHSRRGCRWDPDYDLEWHWTVTVPADVDLDAATVNGGDLIVAGVRGRIEAGNVNGRVTLSGLVGAVDASTVNGRILAEYAAMPTAAGSFNTVNGEIEIGLPRGSSAELAFETMNGEIFTDFEAVAVPQRVTADRGNRGHNSFRLDHDAVVRIGNGGPRFECETLNGDIVVREI